MLANKTHPTPAGDSLNSTKLHHIPPNWSRSWENEHALRAASCAASFWTLQSRISCGYVAPTLTPATLHPSGEADLGVSRHMGRD